MKVRDFTGCRFGRLTVIGRAPTMGPAGLRLRWQCQCDCGTRCIVLAQYLSKVPPKQSCGCLGKEPKYFKHGESNSGLTPEYRCWSSMKTRCFNTRSAPYHNYGGRGITMCASWRDSFPSFLADVGRRPSQHHSIERIDNDGHYEPGNVRWVTRKEQQNNRRPYTKWLPRRRAADGRFADTV